MEERTCKDCAHHGMLEKDMSKYDNYPDELHACINYMVYWVEDDDYAVDCDGWEPDGSAQ